MKKTFFCFLNRVPGSGGHAVRPDGPDGADFLLLADLPDLAWGLYQIRPNRADGTWAPEIPVSDELAALIESGKRYPPALALARQEMGQVFGDHHPEPADFARSYAVAIRTYLSRQHESPFVVAQALRGDGVALVAGEWYWVLKVSGSPTVASWVSDDFHLHESDMNDFDLTGQQLKQLGYSG